MRARTKHYCRKRFDAFLAYNRKDKNTVKRIGRRLRRRGLKVWLDEWEIKPGDSWLKRLESQMPVIRTAVVFIGDSGVGPWQRVEIEGFLREFVQRGCPVIPVILPSVPSSQDPPKLPVFLRGMMWVDFRDDSDPIDKLKWGITGKKSSRRRSRTRRSKAQRSNGKNTNGQGK